MALYSFIQSLNTTFGVSIYEPVALELAKERFAEAKLQVSPSPAIYAAAHAKIQEIMRELEIATSAPNKVQETEALRKICREGGEISKVRLMNVDLWLKGLDGKIFMVEIKTVKPNIGSFQKHKRTLLEWVASELTRNPNARVSSFLAIPYNPYAPSPYKRWTMKGMLDLREEILVAEEFWDFLGGEGAYRDLLDCFEEAGIELRPEIDAYFARFNGTPSRGSEN